MSLTYDARPKAAVATFVIQGQHRGQWCLTEAPVEASLLVETPVTWECKGCGWDIEDGDAAWREHAKTCAKPWPQRMRG